MAPHREGSWCHHEDRRMGKNDPQIACLSTHLQTRNHYTMPFNASHLRDASRKGRDAAASRNAERDAKLVSVLEQLAAYVLSLRPSDEELKNIAENNPKWSSVTIWSCKTPSKNRETGEPLYPASETHFSGWSKDGGLSDPSEGGYPAIGLCQGFPKQRGDRRGDPSTMPKNKVLAHYINERLFDEAGGDPDKALVARGAWNPKKKQFEFHLIWNLPEYEKWQRELIQKQEEWRKSRADKRAAEEASIAADAKLMTLDQHLARQKKPAAAAAAPAPQPEPEPEPEAEETLGGFVLQKKKKRGGRR